MSSLNEYIPRIAVIEKSLNETPDVKTFGLRFKDRTTARKFDFAPGQFLELSISGYGEAPFTFSSLSEGGKFELSVKNVGPLTNALHSLRKGAVVGIRGPYGNTFPIDRLKGKDLLVVGGGIGLAPLRPVIQHVLKNRGDFGRLEIVYGARTPSDLVYKRALNVWKKVTKTKVHLTVDLPDEGWGGECGVVCVLFPKVKLDPSKSCAIVCGPGVMIKAAALDILKLGFRDEDIICSLERHMRCGIGKCGHCYIKGKYVCTDGPNFTLREMRELGVFS